MTQAELEQITAHVTAGLAPVFKALKADMIARTEAIRAEVAPLIERERQQADKLAAIEALLAQPRKAA